MRERRQRFTAHENILSNHENPLNNLGHSVAARLHFNRLSMVLQITQRFRDDTIRLNHLLTFRSGKRPNKSTHVRLTETSPN